MSEFPPSGLRDRTPSEIGDADWTWSAHRRASVMDGVCPECAGNMPITSIHVCDDHQPDWDAYHYCENCESIFRTLVSHICEQCKYRWSMPASNYLTREPAVTAFFYEHGIEFDYSTLDQFSLLLDVEHELLSENPLRLDITIPLEGDQLSLTFDGRMEVVSMERSG